MGRRSIYIFEEPLLALIGCMVIRGGNDYMSFASFSSLEAEIQTHRCQLKLYAAVRIRGIVYAIMLSAMCKGTFRTYTLQTTHIFTVAVESISLTFFP